ncbi:carbohydrate ABC transporter permease [Glycomyces sp. A-F 0318]|uniref:carbohydrate ABC transporter permease n=1 Tax=Glycomyces amatae TaxID=2881355 RepID=UPI001E4748FB|nr:carbohydrate ABC transporter permease [Glycomyces amatae]MCD0447307.1 carbohydrate ABC transporter permease [Glycomyces amatae]
MTTETTTAARRPRPFLVQGVKHAVVIAVGVLMTYPLAWMLVSAVRDEGGIFSNAGLLPIGGDFANFAEGWDSSDFPFSRYLVNSSLVALGAIVGNLVSCSMAAYAFARLRFRGRRAFFAIMLLTIMLPIHVVIVPQYVIFSQMDWVNTFWPLVVPKFLATDAFFVFLMVQFIRGIPRELDEAARIDGAGFFRTWASIILPLMRPALVTTTIFTFIWTWNDFFSQLIYLADPSMYTTSVALRSLVDSTSASAWGPLFAMSVVSLLPVFIVFLVGQRYLVQGIATTGGK